MLSAAHSIFLGCPGSPLLLLKIQHDCTRAHKIQEDSGTLPEKRFFNQLRNKLNGDKTTTGLLSTGIEHLNQKACLTLLSPQSYLVHRRMRSSVDSMVISIIFCKRLQWRECDRNVYMFSPHSRGCQFPNQEFTLRGDHLTFYWKGHIQR